MNYIIKKFNELSNVELYEILKSRAEIFVKEQNIVYVDEDNIDYDSIHVFKMEDNRVVSYLRAFYVEKDIIKLGRVLTLDHGKGLGRELMEVTLDKIPKMTNCKKIILSAQKYAVPFYEKFGLKVVSDEYIEEDIVHLDMEIEF